MAKSVEDQVLDKKTKEQIRQELLEVINTKVKDEIVETVANDVRISFNEEKKDEIKEEISRELVIDIKEEINKEQKKITRRKSFKIFRLQVYILALIAIVVFLVYKLYMAGGLDILKKYQIVENNKDVATTTVSTVNKDLTYYINNFGYLVDSVYVTNLELLKGNYSVDNIDITDKLGMVYNTLSEDKILKEGIIYTITEQTMKNAYIGVFGNDNGYKGTNFTANGISYAYQESTTSYLAIVTSEVKKQYEFNNTIMEVKESGDTLVFTTKVGIIKDNQLYNVFNMNESLGIMDEIKDTDYQKDLSSVDYTFKKINDKYYLTNIAKK